MGGLWRQQPGTPIFREPPNSLLQIVVNFNFSTHFFLLVKWSFECLNYKLLYLSNKCHKNMSFKNFKTPLLSSINISCHRFLLENWLPKATHPKIIEMLFLAHKWVEQPVSEKTNTKWISSKQARKTSFTRTRVFMTDSSNR